MRQQQPLFARDSTAARLLDMSKAEFLSLVKIGALPRPRTLGGVARWDVEELRRVLSGEAAEGLGGVDW